jgi:predicted nucleotidyltransferase component of viral defense system
MAKKTILTKNQRLLLDEISKNKAISDVFYLGGGTALAEFYLKHRLSEDLDFFTENEFDPSAISAFFKSIQKKLRITKIDYQQSFNRNLFFVTIGKDTIKTEFTYYPFPRIESKSKMNNIEIDSLLDIAVNKVFTIYQKPRSRDFIDLYLIIKKTGLKMADLIKKAKAKFDYHMDLLQLGTQFVKATELEDFPKMLIKLPHSTWQKFFLAEAAKFKNNILK